MGETCETCTWFMPLSPGHAAICGEKWRHLPWNAAVPLTGRDDHCENYNRDTEATSVKAGNRSDADGGCK